MSQVFEFRVVNIAASADAVDVTLNGKFHPVYTTPIFLHLPAGELSKFSIGQSYSLTGAEEVEVIETAPWGGYVEELDDAFSDGSPVPSDSECPSREDDSHLTQQDREQPGYRPPAPLGIPGEGLR